MAGTSSPPSGLRSLVELPSAGNDRSRSWPGNSAGGRAGRESVLTRRSTRTPWIKSCIPEGLNANPGDPDQGSLE
jgi:hypothetical protein